MSRTNSAGMGCICVLWPANKKLPSTLIILYSVFPSRWCLECVFVCFGSQIHHETAVKISPQRQQFHSLRPEGACEPADSCAAPQQEKRKYQSFANLTELRILSTLTDGWRLLVTISELNSFISKGRKTVMTCFNWRVLMEGWCRSLKTACPFTSYGTVNQARQRWRK